MQAFLKTIAFAVCFALGLSAVVRADEAQQGPEQTKTRKILFIGNSYTYYNSLNLMVADMMTVSGIPTKAERSTPGGWRLRQHFNGQVPEKNPQTTSTPEWLKSEQWDYVVMQEQSSAAVDSRAEFLEYGKKLNDMILDNSPNAKVLLYQTWGRCDGMFEGYGSDLVRKAEVAAAWEKRYGAPSETTIEALKDGMQGGYDALADATNATVVPVGKAFKEAGEKVDLYADEKEKRPHHPSLAGTYLGACVFFKKLTGKSPVGLWQKLKDAGKDYKVREEDAAYLEGIADKVVE